MHLAFCSNAYTRRGLEDAFDSIAELGFAAVELLCDRPHYWPQDDPDGSRARALGERLRELGLAASNVNANTAVGYYDLRPGENLFGPSLSSIDPEDREARLVHARRALALAHAVGAPSISVTSGSCGDDHPPEAAMRMLEQSLRELLQAAELIDIRVGLEAEPGLLLEHAHEIAALIERIDHPLLGFNLDVGHCVVIGEDPAAIIRAHADRIWHLHLEDIRDRKHFHRIPGEGDVDFVAIAAALKDVGYDGFASIELYAHKADPETAARRALEVLGPLFERS